jgi:hypothetical protein
MLIEADQLQNTSQNEVDSGRYEIDPAGGADLDADRVRRRIPVRWWTDPLLANSSRTRQNPNPFQPMTTFPSLRFGQCSAALIALFVAGHKSFSKTR